VQDKGIQGQNLRGLSGDVPKELISGVNAMHVKNKLQGASRSGSHTTRKERVPFGMNLSEEDEASNSGSTSQTDMQLALTVDRFYARKFGMKTGSGADKRAVLKVSKTGTVKK
jgi:hypothetical protein